MFCDPLIQVMQFCVSTFTMKFIHTEVINFNVSHEKYVQMFIDQDHIPFILK